MQKTLAVLFFAALTFVSLGFRHLWEPDEGRYAVIAANAAFNGEWLIPTMNGMPHLDKPPLVMWATAGAFLLWGKHDAAARIVPWLAAVVIMLLAAALSRDDEDNGLAAILVLGSTAGWVAGTNILNLDMAVAALITAALWAWWRGIHREEGPGWWAPLMWSLMGLGFLAKGLIGFVLPIGVVFAAAIVERDWRRLRPLWSPVGVGLALAITLPWLLLVEREIPGFIRFFLVHEHFARYTTESHGRGGGFGFYPVALLVFFLPWSLVVFTRSFWRGLWERLKVSELARFHLVWVVAIVGFFSLSSSKLPGYVLPALAPCAYLLGQDWRRREWSKGIAWAVASVVMLLHFIAYTGLAWQFHAGYIRRLSMDHVIGWGAGVLFLGIGMAVAMVRWRELLLGKLFPAAAAGLAVGWMAFVAGAAALDPLRSPSHLAANIAPAGADAEVVCVESFPRGLSYYLGRPVLLTSPIGAHFYLHDTPESEMPQIIPPEQVFARIGDGERLVIVLQERRWQKRFTEFPQADYHNWGNVGKWRVLATFPRPEPVTP